MTSPHPKILLTGATGYIGGTILSQLLSSPNASQYGPITCLVRGEDRKKHLDEKFGSTKVNPVLFNDLEDSLRIIEVASQHDIVINTVVGFHPTAPRNLVLGLAKRKKQTGKDVWIIHTSGTSNMADRPITKKYTEKKYVEGKDFSDKEDIYGYEKMRNEETPYEQRTAELSLIDAGLETGVKTLVIMSPLIWGIGTGEFNRLTIQVPSLIKGTLKLGYTPVIGEGKGVWNRVHVQDLAKLYQTALDRIIAGEEVPSGKKGIIFSEAGSYTWEELSQRVAEAAHKAGKVKTPVVKSMGLKEAAESWSFGDELMTELGLASNSRTKGDVSRSLGWKPEKGDKEWNEHFEEELKAVIAQGA